MKKLILKVFLYALTQGIAVGIVLYILLESGLLPMQNKISKFRIFKLMNKVPSQDFTLVYNFDMKQRKLLILYNVDWLN